MISISLAVKRDYKNGDEYLTDFINCTAFGTPAKYINNYLHKGEWLAVQGTLQINSYKAQDGATKYYTNVLIRSAQGFNQGGYKDSNTNTLSSGFVDVSNFENDGLPFA